MWLNASISRDVVADLGGGVAQLRQGLQVSTISRTFAIAVAGAPAACSIATMRALGACHHLMCNIRNVRRTTPGSCDRNSCKDLPKSNLVQSVGMSAA